MKSFSKKLLSLLLVFFVFSGYADAGTLAVTRKVSGASITAAGFNTNYDEIEAVVNGHIDSDNIEADGVTAAALNSDVVRVDYGLKQHTDGALMVDPSDTNPGLEASDGGLRVKVDDSSIERASGGIQVKAGGVTAAMLHSAALAAAYPVGSVYINASVSTNPATLLGFGTWSAIGAGRVLVGVDAGQTEFDTLGETGGENTHTLTAGEMPAHTHSWNSGTIGGASGGAFHGGTDSQSLNTGSAGSGGAHNNLQPYITVYMWVRTA